MFLTSRKVQGAADLAALAAARDSDKGTQAAEATVSANGFRHPVITKVVLGVYSPDASLPAAQRFVEGGASPNAVKVTLTTEADLTFGAPLLGKETMTVTRSAIAARSELASFSVGTRLAAVNGGVGNALLTALTGSSVSLTVMDYNALAGAKADLLTYVPALATHAGLKAATFDEALALKLSSGEALGVLADVLTSDGQAAAGVAVQKMATAAGSSRKVQLADLFDLGPYGEQDHATAGTVKVGAMDMAGAILTLAQQGRQLKLDLAASIPGLADTDVWLAIGERPNNSPWVQVAQNGSSLVIRTAQTRLYIDAKVGSGLGGALTGAGVSLVDIPVLVEAASAQARLSRVSCANGTVSLEAAPSLGSITLGQIDTTKLDDFKHPLTTQPASLFKLLLVQATGSAHVDIGGASWQTVDFSASEVTAGTIKTVQTSDIAKASVASLLANTSIGVSVGGLGLGLSGATLTPALQSVLTTAATPLDGVLNGVTDILGVHLGQADLRVAGLRCRQAALVS